MGAFTKTLIVDSSLTDPVVHPYYKTIKEAAQYFIDQQIGGTIIVEQGIYNFDQLDQVGNTRTTVYVPSNVSIIGSGNVVIRITEQNIAAFKNANSSNTNIKISGFKIIYDCPDDPPSYPYLQMHLVYLTNCSKCFLKNLTITSNNRSIWREFYAICITGTIQNATWGNIVEGCRIHDYGSTVTEQYGGGIMISGLKLTNPQFNIIKNNIISQVGAKVVEDDDHGAGLLIFYDYNPSDPEVHAIPNNTIITNNIFFDLKGVHTLGISTNAINYVVKGNIFDRCNLGFYPSGASRCAAFGNIAVNNHTDSIHIRYSDSQPYETEFHAFTGNICTGNEEAGILAQNGTNYCSFFGGQYSQNDDLGLRIQHETEGVSHPELNPKYNCVAGNIAVNNDNVQNIDISETEYNKQIVANNIGRLNA